MLQVVAFSEKRVYVYDTDAQKIEIYRMRKFKKLVESGVTIEGVLDVSPFKLHRVIQSTSDTALLTLKYGCKIEVTADRYLTIRW